MDVQRKAGWKEGENKEKRKKISQILIIEKDMVQQLVKPSSVKH